MLLPIGDKVLLPKIVTQRLVKDSKKLLSFAHKLLPNKLEKFVIQRQVNRLCKPFMKDGELDFLDGKTILIELSDISAKWYFEKHYSNILMVKVGSSNPDVTFSATVNALVLMASQEIDPDMLFFKRKLSVTGDTELGLEIKNLIDLFDLDLLDLHSQRILKAWSSEIIRTQSF